MKFGLLGEHLSHSYSVPIHRELHNEEYKLYEVSPDGVEDFLKNTDLDGLNVTIPYKQTVMPFCVSVSAAARKIGCVNTLKRAPDGWHGYNTDYDGFRFMLERGGIDPSGKKCLILGNGGASLTARTVLADLGASEITVISRSRQKAGSQLPTANNQPPTAFDTYDDLNRHTDARIIVNTTPVGMYPDNGRAPVELGMFPDCEGVADVIYNPGETELLTRGAELGIPCAGGLGMLVAQARRSAEIWLNENIPEERVGDIIRKIDAEKRNIVLIGMPGCGKTTIAGLLCKMTGRRLIDTDEMVERRTGRKIPDIITTDGEEAFRRLETEAITEAGKQSGCVIATGGGCVKEKRNCRPLRQNGRIFWIKRALELLPSAGRPLSQASTPEALYAERKDMYASFADVVIENNGTPESAAERIAESGELMSRTHNSELRTKNCKNER